MKLASRFLPLAVVAALALAACTPDARALPSQSASESAAPAQRQSGPLTLDEVQAILKDLPADAPFTWTGGAATASPANAQFTWLDYSSDPLQCAPLYHLGLLSFEDDREVAPSDVIVGKSLSDPAGAGPEDDRFLASVSVRILDEPERGMRDVIYPLAATAPACEDGYVITHIDLGTDSSVVTSLEELSELADVAGIDGALVILEDTDGAFATDQVVSAWVAVDNVVICLHYYIGPDLPEAGVPDAQALAEAVALAFSHAP